MGTEILDSDFPTEITEDYWVYASVVKPQRHPQKFKQIKSGKWLVFSDINDHDSVWQKIKRATQDGLLGVGAKAATSKPNPNAPSADEKVICIYTYNWLDIDDVYRVEKALRKIGIEQTLYYKTDSDTIAGQYKVNGSKNISKYVSKATKSYKKFDLASLHGIGYDKIQILKRIGIKNFDDLLAFDTSKKLSGVGISTERINKLKLSVLSQIENRIYRLTPIEFPEGEIIHFDIETDLSLSFTTKKVWSIAIHHNKKIKHFYAETWKQEKKILKDFLSYIKKVDNPHLFSYSGVGFDKNILSAALKRHDLDFEYFLNCNHLDLCTLIRQNYILPIGAYGLKPVGKYFGYKFKHDHLDGLYVAMQYLHCQATGAKLPKTIFNYIEDDVKSMDFIINKLKTRKDIKHII
jgi:predicted RecB family nuclease